MKITNCPDIQLVAQELEGWAHEVGWKSIAVSVAQHHSDFHESIDTMAGLHNVSQKIRRVFRGSSARYRGKAVELTPAVLAAMPADRRARLVKPGSRELKLACVIKRFSGFATTALLDPESIDEEIDELISTLTAYQQISGRPQGGGRGVMPFELIALVFMLETIATGITVSVAGVLILLAGTDFAGDGSK